MKRRPYECLAAFCLALMLLSFAKPAAAVVITRICSDEILIEDGTSNTGMYVGYEILNDGPLPIVDVWVTLDGFAGGVVSLAPYETGAYSLGTLIPGEAQNAYLYLKSNGSTSTPQSHDVNVRLGSPTNPPIAAANFSYTAVDADPSLPCNEVHTVTLMGSPVVGTLVQVTVIGESGAIGSAGDYVATPASADDFPANDFRLVDVHSRLWTVGDGCVTQVADVEGSMIIAVPADADGYCYETTYSFRAQMPTAASTPISPRQYIISGQQPKFQCADPPAAVIPPIGNAWWKGTEYSPMGNASLWWTPETLTVSNIGSSGLDGVVFDFGASQGGRLSWEGSVVVIPVGSAIDFDTHTEAGGILPCVKVLRQSVSLTRITPDFSLIGSQLTYEIWDDGTFVGEYVGLPTDVTAQDMPFACEVDNDMLPETLAAPFAPSLGCRLQWENGQSFDVPAVPGFSATGDELRIMADGYFVTSIAGLGVRFETPTPPISMEFTDLHQLMFGRRHQVVGGLMQFNLTAPPISPSGPRRATAADHTDAPILLPPGVTAVIRWELDASETGLGVLWDPGNAATAGDMDSHVVYGEDAVGTGLQLESVSGAFDGSSWMLTPDFSPLGSSTVYLRVVDAAGNLVHEVPAWSGSISVQTSDFATRTEVVDYDIPGFELGYPMDVGVDIPGHGTFMGRRIQMLSNAPKNYARLTAVERGIAILPGGTFTAYAELNSTVLPSPGNPTQEHAATGVAFIREYGDHVVVENIGSSGLDGVVIEPDAPPAGQNIQFYPMGAASAQYGETDFQFLQRLMGEDVPTEMMSLNLNSDGVAVHVRVSPGQSSTPTYEVTLMRLGVVQTTFLHSDPATPIADLPEWPTGAGYRVLEYEDQPWLMYLDLGQEMEVTFPDNPVPVSGASAGRIQADEIIIITQDTAQPPEPAGRSFGLKVKDILYFPYKKGGGGGPSGVISRTPEPSVLNVAYPNPFNPTTTLAFDLARRGRAKLTVYDVSGAVVAVVHDGVLSAGPHKMQWDGTDPRGARVASGVYFVELRAPDGRSHVKINLLK